MSDRRLGPDDWIAAARAVLIRSGHAAVKVDALAQRLAVTRGSFYWHFKSRDDLLAQVVRDWSATNSATILDALGQPGPLRGRLTALVRIWIEETEYSPAYDSAMRDWARVSPMVAQAVGAADARRLEAFVKVFRESGMEADEALVRARIMYFHQVGYYTIGLRESRRERNRYAGLYLDALIGTAEPPDAGTASQPPGPGTADIP